MGGRRAVRQIRKGDNLRIADVQPKVGHPDGVGQLDRRFGGQFEGEDIHLDGQTWTNCVFIQCTLRRNSRDTLLVNAIYDDCTFIGDGWPPEFRR